MNRKLTIAVTSLLLVLVAAMGPARASDLYYVSGPGSGQGVNYTVPLMVMSQGDTVTYVNGDVALHDVRSTLTGPDQPWCTTFPFSFGHGKCPLFTSKLIGLSSSSPVYGIDAIPAGTYDFICSIHSWMKGTLVVL